MTPGDLDILLQQGEGTTIEFKENLSASFAREMVALANTIGGKILLGVRDDGTVSGIKDSNGLRARVQDIARNCDPPVKVRVEPVGRVFAVHVRESDAKPVQCGDGFFWRQGAVTQKLNRNEIRDFFRAERVIQFDRSPCPGFRYPGDFDRDKFDTWLRYSGITGQPAVEDVLVNIEAAERAGKKLLFRNAGVLFFAKNVRRFFPHAYITGLLARDTDKVHILDRKDFSGGIVADIEDALRFVERNTRTAYRIEGLRRQNVPEYPMRALREAITNAVMHRDWFFEGSNVFVEIYTDRIEIISPGSLPKGLTPTELGRTSVRRNALIADLLHRIDFIEKAGTGIRRIREEAKRLDCPEPEFASKAFVTVTFRPNPQIRTEAEKVENDRVAEGMTPQVTPSVTPQDTPRVAPPETPQDRLLWAMEGEMTGQELRQVLGLKDLKHFRKTYLQPALDAGLIEMTLPDKSHSRRQRYRLTPAGSAHRQRPQKGELTPQVTPSVTPQDTPRVVPPETPQDRLLWAMEGEMTGQELRQVLALKDPKHFRKTYLQPALDTGLIEMTLPDKPHSRRQRYRLTPRGSTQRRRLATMG